MKNLKKLLGGTKSLKSSQKRAFTLAEVLITLAIIGVVAALTIPVVVHKYQQKQMYTQFMKSYNTLTNVINLSTAENGNPGTWAVTSENINDITKQYIAPYLQVVSQCLSSASGCADYNISALTGDDLGGTFGQLLGMLNSETPNVLTLADGSSAGILYDFSDSGITSVTIAVDTNGKKGPNAFGRDIFMFAYSSNHRTVNGKYIEVWGWEHGYQKASQQNYSGSIVNIPSNCDPSSPAVIYGMPNGYGCAGRLLEAGKMDY